MSGIAGKQTNSSPPSNRMESQNPKLLSDMENMPPVKLKLRNSPKLKKWIT